MWDPQQQAPAQANWSILDQLLEYGLDVDNTYYMCDERDVGSEQETRNVEILATSRRQIRPVTMDCFQK